MAMDTVWEKVWGGFLVPVDLGTRGAARQWPKWVSQFTKHLALGCMWWNSEGVLVYSREWEGTLRGRRKTGVRSWMEGPENMTPPFSAQVPGDWGPCGCIPLPSSPPLSSRSHRYPQLCNLPALKSHCSLNPGFLRSVYSDLARAPLGGLGPPPSTLT